MLQHTRLDHRFVQFIPEHLEAGVLYISIEYATAAHSCCCGCGEQVITPFAPTDWKLTFDGETISLWPSIGNWNFKCRSHYIIRNSRILQAAPWDQKHIVSSRRRDRRRKQQYYQATAATQEASPKPTPNEFSIWESIRVKLKNS